MRTVYLDHNSTTALDKRVLAEMLPYFTEQYGNPANIHKLGKSAKEAVELAQKRIADVINAKPKEIVFTSGGTESNNMAISGVMSIFPRPRGRQIICSNVEHLSIHYLFKKYAQMGAHVTFIPVDKYGMINPDDVAKSIGPNTALVSIMLANNEIGTIQPIREIANIVKKYDIVFHCDAIQCLGKLPVDVEELSIDILTLSSHKVYGPKGVGAVYIRSGIKIDPFVYGPLQDSNYWAGTQNVPSIVGFGKAAEIAANQLIGEMEHLQHLRDLLEEKLSSLVVDMKINGHPELRLPNTSSITFHGVDSEVLVLELDLKGIYVSSAAASSSHLLEPSHVLKAIGISDADAASTIRFSLGRENTLVDIEYVAQILPGIIERLRTIRFSEDLDDWSDESDLPDIF
ncbi:MAG: cysteine desulfurase [Candidatus Coatesbacteria bacterium]|nr:cysteine desulfurase [Candidatus Coatesbacteria bacterium]